MANANMIILTGRLTRDPQLRYTSNEIPVTHFTLAVNRRKNKNGENGVDFLDCTAWRELAKICSEYLKKGKLVAVQGRLQIDKYESKGQKKTTPKVVVDEMQMLDPKFFDKSTTTEEATDHLPALN